jgi:5-dehydro-2-deoxygluconokinase
MTVVDVEGVDYSQFFFPALITAGTVCRRPVARRRRFTLNSVSQGRWHPIIFDVDYRPYSLGICGCCRRRIVTRRRFVGRDRRQ